MDESQARADQRRYRLRIAGQLDEEFVAAYCPAHTERRSDGDTTLLDNIATDQSGIVGLIRTLHNLGCTILSLSTLDPTDARGDQL